MEILLDDLEAEREVGTLMPENLVGAMSYGWCTIWLFSVGLRKSEEIPFEAETVLEHATAHVHGAAICYDKSPLSFEAHAFRPSS